MKEKIKRRKESFMQGVMAMMFAQVLIKIIGLVYRLYLTNKEGFGDEGNAIYSAGYQIYALLLTLSSIGVPGAISKLISEKNAQGNYKAAHRIFKIALAVFSAIGFIGTLILFLGADYIANVMLQIPEAEMTLVALSPAVFFVSIASVMRGYFAGMQNLTASAKSQTYEQVFKTLLTVILVEIVGLATGLNTTLMAAGANLATTLAVVLSFFYLYRYYNINKKEIWKQTSLDTNYKYESPLKIIKSLLFVSIPMSLSSLISAINKNVDGVTVVRGLKNFMTEAQATAQYGILMGKVDILIGLPLSFNIAFATALVPSVSASKVQGDDKNIQKRVSFSLLITILLGLPCTLGLCIFAQPILNLLFPNATAGAEILQVAAFTVIFTVIAQTINGALQGIGKLAVPAIALGVGVLVKFILNLILVPMENIGILGAAFSSVVCHMISCGIGFAVLRKYVKLELSFTKAIIKPILATIIMSISSYFIYLKLLAIMPERISTIIALISAVIIYILAVIVLKIFTEEDIKSFPGGNKIYSILLKMGIYKEKNA